MGDESPHEVDAPLSSSRTYSHREKCPGSLCSYISSPSFRTRSTDEVQFLFHDPCDTCSSFTEREPLCNFCSHLRLHHLIICLGDELMFLKVSLDYYHKDRDSGVSRVITTKRCAFCELIAKATGAYLEIFGRNEEARRPETCSLELHLVNYQDQLSLWRYPPGGGADEIELHYTRIATPSIPSSPKYIIPDLVDWNRVQGWLSHCNQKHNCKRSESSTVPEGFRLIDVEDRCVTSEFRQDAKLGVNIKFVALSYVWGESNVSRHDALLSSNKSEFEAAGGLKEGKVPQAIEDAITICKRLKQRYLWVDRFCIIQNHEDGGEKQRQIDAMGDIYSSAEFTIIHASGESMHSPIPGVSKERKVFQSKSVIQGLEFTMLYPDFETFMKTSKWNTRGWTYQEAILSPRKLVLTSFEVWFECNDPDDPYRREDQYWTREETPIQMIEKGMTQFRMNPFSLSEIPAFTNFARHLESYTARSLTNQSDILNAFTGILALVYGGERNFHGLPEADFDQALLWYCDKNDRPTRWGQDCPSWSWTSVSETVTAPVSNSARGFIGTLVWWVYRGPDGGLADPRPRSSLRPRRAQPHSPQIHLLFAWWGGCIEAPVPENLERQLENYSKHLDDSDIAREWPTLEKVWDDIRSARNAGPETFMDLSIGLRKEDQLLVDKLPSRALLTRAQTALFAVPRCQSKFDFQMLFIVDSNGERVGMVEGRDLDVTEPTLAESKPSQDPCEFMAISLSKVLAKPGRRRDFPVPDDGGRSSYMHHRLFSGMDGDEDRRPVVNVLLIGRTEESWLAHRISVGWIYLVDWCKAQREFKTIALE